MRAIFTVALLVAMGLAGCADDLPQSTGSADETAFEEIETQATSTTGVIRGVVVDSAIVPIADVTISLKGQDKTTSTNEQGAFAFDGLEAGNYFLEAKKIGFGKVQTSVSVEAGVAKPAITRIQMESNPSELPQVVPFAFRGYIACSWTLPVVALAMCSVPELVGVDLDDNFLTSMDTEGYPDFVQAEQLWQSSQPTGAGLSLSFWDGSTFAPRGVRGASPLMVNGDRAFLENGTGSASTGSPMNVPGEQVSFRTFAAGVPGTEAGGTWGVGVTLQQKFDVYTNIFYNTQPYDGWLFSVDGEYPVEG
jgi:hypothetical protein